MDADDIRWLTKPFLVYAHFSFSFLCLFFCSAEKSASNSFLAVKMCDWKHKQWNEVKLHVQSQKRQVVVEAKKMLRRSREVLFAWKHHC